MKFLKKNRYLVFASSEYYSSGGAADYRETFRCKKKAIELSKSIIGNNQLHHHTIEWSHVFDLKTNTIIHREGENDLEFYT